jgi:hypothetical protein
VLGALVVTGAGLKRLPKLLRNLAELGVAGLVAAASFFAASICFSFTAEGGKKGP